MRPPKRPTKLPLLPGLRWKGHLRFNGARLPDGRYPVAFDAEETDPKVYARYVFDRAILTAEQLKDWTGWSEEDAERC